MKVIQEFKEFAMRGNVIDMAVGIVIGAAFTKIVSSLVSDVIAPVLSLVSGGVDLENLFFDLSGNGHATLATARQAGAATLNYGLFLATVLDFLLVAAALFVVVRAVNHARRRIDRDGPTPTPTTRNCPHCIREIPLAATRCAHCTSELQPA